ncbi:DUF1120 domain-containing protein [Pantoea dispersa]|uniref:DUF1120 domain-containing protein n=1 Tax=Pantoea dispersa TaxID=59814 RepID=UPI002DBFDBDB|nr:DUF1120 domain-containing protein [Pantoea dispersa]MEB5974116.1 DUF1120 domain-containing protein [Pantoea dispersa]
MKKFIKTFCAIAIMAAANQATAESFQLGITGTFKPSACSPSIDNGGTVDYGVIKTESLSKDDYTLLDQKEIILNINCDSPAKVALTASSGRKGSALVSNTEGKTGAGKPMVTFEDPNNRIGYAGAVGLGLDGEKKIGAYIVTIGDVLKDGKIATGLRSSTKLNWSIYDAYTLYTDNGADQYFTVSEGTTNTPGAFTTATFPLIIKGYINKASELDISKPIKLDGLTNIEMVYL